MANSGLTEEGVRKFLRRADLTVRVYDSVGSTNTLLGAMAGEGAPAGLALIAGAQTAGRGRRGRSFYSPDGTGVYISLLLRPDLSPAAAVPLTACAAVAAAEAIEEVSGARAGIKWVNDIFIDGRKVCGILTEAETDAVSSRLRHVIIGLGVNISEPEGGFPSELADIAGAVFPGPVPEAVRCRLAAGILDRLSELAEDPGDPAVLEAYRSRSVLSGRRIRILEPGREPQEAAAVGINDDYSLQVCLPDGTQRSLVSGEVSIRPDE